MPRGDGTGPAGQGPMTGRGAGYCVGYGMPGYMNPAGGRRYFGYGRGYFGGGRGWRNWQRAGMGLPAWGRYPYQPTPYQSNPSQEKEVLSEELKALKEEMKEIQERLKDLKGSKKIKVEEEK